MSVEFYRESPGKFDSRTLDRKTVDRWTWRSLQAHLHTRHILPPSEIDLGLCWADFTDSEGKHLFHRIG